MDALLDRALGPEGYYGYFVANAHADRELSAESGVADRAAGTASQSLPRRSCSNWLLAGDRAPWRRSAGLATQCAPR